MATLALSSAFLAISSNPKLRAFSPPPPAPSGFPPLPLRPIVTSSSLPAEPQRSSSPAPLALSLASALASSQPALALVDDRLSTEGTGLGLGISNPLLIWILLGVFTLIWALYFVYSSSLPGGDDDSGLSL